MTNNPPLQTISTYKRMAKEARYRPAAPSDGCGNISVHSSLLDLNAEALTYAADWLKEEERMDYFLGCPDYLDRPALIFIVEAARALNGVDHGLAARLLRLALAEIEGRSR